MRTVPAPPTVTITPFSLESLSNAVSTSTPTSGTWPGSSRALFVPFRLWAPIVAVKLFAVNGTAVSGNVDIGIYDESGTRLVSSGSVAQTGTSVIQIFDITDTLLGVGLFFLAMAVDNTTAQFFRRTANAAHLRTLRVYQTASAFVLPTTVTFAAPASGYYPLFGLSTDVVV